MSGEINGIYFGLVRRPYRFVVKRRISNRIEHYELHRPASLWEFVAELLEVFAKESTNFIPALLQLDDREFMSSKHKTRRYFAESRELLYIGNPKLADKYAKKHSGCWFVTNIGVKEVRHISYMVSKVANVSYKSISELSL